MVRMDDIYVVSGLPRSGTSMMMQMLKAGGLPVVADGVRVADDDNPRGYYELEAVRALRDDSSWVKDARGKVVKVVSQLLFDLPEEHNYRVLFMRRHIDEILASQSEMLVRSSGKRPTPEEDKELRILSIRHLNDVIDWLGSRPNMKVLYVNYARTGEQATLDAIANLVGLDLDREAMKKAIDSTLYRNRRAEVCP